MRQYKLGDDLITLVGEYDAPYTCSGLPEAFLKLTYAGGHTSSFHNLPK